MALSDALERLQGISGEGPRATDFAMLTQQRGKTRQKLLEQLRLAEQRKIQFQGSADQGDGVPNPGGYLGGNGKFNGKFAMYPLKGNLRVTSPYGVNRVGHKSAHTGIDWGDPAGTPIYAPGDATVRALNHDKIYGNQTILDFGGGYSAMFGHQSKFGNIAAGQNVKAGQLIGYVGSTGWSTGPHLHFETWYNNKPVNPLTWFQ